jgi:uncharacterized membrane protein
MLLTLAVSSLSAQGRGGRQGGPGDRPTGPLCLDPTDVKSMQIVHRTTPIDGTPAVTTTVEIVGNPGVQNLLSPCTSGVGGGDGLSRFLFSPDFVMSHQQAINLTETQRTAIRQAISEAQQKTLSAQFQESAEREKFEHLLNAPQVDERAVLGELDRLLSLERDIKHGQLSLMARIKNTLSAEQQQSLVRLRADD